MNTMHINTDKNNICVIPIFEASSVSGKLEGALVGEVVTNGVGSAVEGMTRCDMVGGGDGDVV